MVAGKDPHRGEEESNVETHGRKKPPEVPAGGKVVGITDHDWSPLHCDNYTLHNGPHFVKYPCHFLPFFLESTRTSALRHNGGYPRSRHRYTGLQPTITLRPKYGIKAIPIPRPAI